MSKVTIKNSDGGLVHVSFSNGESPVTLGFNDDIEVEVNESKTVSIIGQSEVANERYAKTGAKTGAETETEPETKTETPPDQEE